MTTDRPPALARHIGFAALVVYGVGDMLGAGVYGLIGKWAGAMGNALWLAFLASMVAASLTGLSYASLGSRYPRAAGAAYIVQRAFGLRFVSYLVGLAVVASGLTSLATQSRAFSGYVVGFLGRVPPGAHNAAGSAMTQPEASALLFSVLVLAFIAGLTFVNLRGIRESTWVNVVCTFVELSGLAIILVAGVSYWGSVDYLELPPVRTAPADPSAAPTALTLTFILQGAVLTFYAFIGFEDMINVTEEVKDPRRTFPVALLTALLVTALVYVAIGITAVSVVPYAELAVSGEPLVAVVRRAAPDFPTGIFSLIAVFAITNTALLNYIMGSRVVYGMAGQGLVPRALGAVHPVRRTPHVAILLLMVIVVALALSGDVRQLAAATSVLLLCVFVIVNASLVVLKRRAGEPPGAFEVPIVVPLGGIAVSAAMLWHADPAAWRIAAVLLAGIALLYGIMRPRQVIDAD